MARCDEMARRTATVVPECIKRDDGMGEACIYIPNLGGLGPERAKSVWQDLIATSFEVPFLSTHPFSRYAYIGRHSSIVGQEDYHSPWVLNQ